LPIAYNTFAAQRGVITFSQTQEQGNRFSSDEIDYFGLVGFGEFIHLVLLNAHLPIGEKIPYAPLKAKH